MVVSACVVAGGDMCLLGGVWLWGACVVAGGIHGGGRGGVRGIRGDMVNEREVCILLEYILVLFQFCIKL